MPTLNEDFHGLFRVTCPKLTEDRWRKVVLYEWLMRRLMLMPGALRVRDAFVWRKVDWIITSFSTPLISPP